MTSAIVTHTDGTKSHHRNVINARNGMSRQKSYVKLLLTDDTIKLIADGVTVELVDESWLPSKATAKQVIAIAHSAGFKLVNTLKNGIELRPANHA